MGRFKSKLDTVRQTYRLCRLGGMPEPSWLQPFLELSQGRGYDLNQGKTKRPANTRRQEFPEDRLIQSFYARHPQAKLIPIDLDSFEPPLAKKAAIKQLELIQQKWPKRAAQEKVEADLKAAGEFNMPEPPSIISQIQAEEERVLMNAIQERREASDSPAETS